MHEVQIWNIDLRRFGHNSGFTEILSADEIMRAQRFVLERDRRRFNACRAALRRVLGGLLDANPTTIEFQYSAYGKPSLSARHQCEIDFNVSHSGDFALIAVSRGNAVGVDLEQIRTDVAADEIAQRFFSATERAALASLPAESRAEAFFRCWTRKEAFIKALGEGLSFPLDAFDVSLAPNEPARLLRVRHDPAAAADWSLYDLPVPAGYVAALAIAGRAAEIVHRTDFI